MKRFCLLITLVGMAYSAFAQNSTTIVNNETGESFEVTVPDGMAITMNEENWEDSVKTYIEKARWGDDMARLQLANCYHYGRGVKPSYVNMMTTFTYYGEYGYKMLNDYLALSDENDPYRLLFDAMENKDSVKMQKLIEIKPVYSKLLNAMILAYEGKTDESIVLLKEAESEECDFTEILLLICYNEKGNADEYESYLVDNANDVPAFYNKLGDIYIGKDFPDSGKKDEKKAVECFMNADKYAQLSKRGANTLIKYYQEEADKGNPLCDATEMERLKRISERDI